MANAYTYTLNVNKIYAQDYSGTQKIYKIDLTVADAGSSVSGISDKFEVSNGTGSFTAFTAAAGSGNIWTLTINSGSELATTDYLAIQVVNATDKSPKVFADFDALYANHQAVYSYTLPAEAGTATINIDTVDGNDFSAATASPSFIVYDSSTYPDTASSKVIIDKPYLGHFTGEVLPVYVTLNNAAGTATNTNYQVTLVNTVTTA